MNTSTKNNQMKSKPLPVVLIIDTNILIEIPEIHNFDLGFHRVHLYILDSVVNELKGIQLDQKEPDKAAKAKKAYELISQLQERTPMQGMPIHDGQGLLFFARVPQEYPAPLDARSVDHQQIAFAMDYLKKNPAQFCAVVTLDRDMADLASAVKPSVKSISPSLLQLQKQLRSFLLRQYQSWLEEKKGFELEHPSEPQTDQGSHSTQEPPKLRLKKDSKLRLQSVVRNFHSRITAAHHRAILAIAPMEARLALTAHLIQCLKRTERRVVLLFVENQALADYWAGELRQRLQLPPQAVHVFHNEGLPQRELPQVVIYRHDQIETRFKQHVARLRDAQRLITILVDGCDLLPPEDLIMLLLGNDQFVGYTRYSLSSSQARSGRILAKFFEEESIVHYTYAEAEEDGWLRPFDLIRRQVPFLPEEVEEYDRVNQVFQVARNEMFREYPSLRRARNPWDALQDLLEGVADSKVAKVFSLREEREEIAQIAANKKLELLDSLRKDCTHPGRNIVYDPSKLWAKGLRDLLVEQKLAAEHLSQETSPEDWDKRWRAFERGNLNALIISSLPPYRMIRSHVNRLMITTPLCPQTELANIVDWTLSHAHPGGDPVEIHLLYVPDTPEEQAMLEFADAICGLRFT